jgi:hypothetical protein
VAAKPRTESPQERKIRETLDDLGAVRWELLRAGEDISLLDEVCEVIDRILLREA